MSDDLIERKADIQPETPLPWEIKKCRCGHKSCDQWAFGNQGSVGFYGDDARYAVHACNAYPEAAARIEALTAEVERLREAFGPIMRHFEVETRDGNAPGHGHTIPGIWDAGNAPDLAGYKCHWCREWNEARAALKDTSPEQQGE